MKVTSNIFKDYVRAEKNLSSNNSILVRKNLKTNIGTCAIMADELYHTKHFVFVDDFGPAEKPIVYYLTQKELKSVTPEYRKKKFVHVDELTGRETTSYITFKVWNYDALSRFVDNNLTNIYRKLLNEN